jgi:hypothetical protein
MTSMQTELLEILYHNKLLSKIKYNIKAMHGHLHQTTEIITYLIKHFLQVQY